MFEPCCPLESFVFYQETAIKIEPFEAHMCTKTKTKMFYVRHTIIYHTEYTGFILDVAPKLNTPRVNHLSTCAQLAPLITLFRKPRQLAC